MIEIRRVDDEIDRRALVLFGLGLLAGLVVVAALCLALTRAIAGRIASRQPAAAGLSAPLAPPPAPRLESDPRAALRRHRAEQQALLGAWAWEDEAAGLARIPVERAREIVLRDGLPPAAAGAPREAEGPGRAAGEEAGDEER